MEYVKYLVINFEVYEEETLGFSGGGMRQGRPLGRDSRNRINELNRGNFSDFALP